jgi:hypothetical protein
MIKPTAKVPLVDNYGKYQVILTEPQEPGCSVTISGLPDNAIVIKADAFKSPDGVFDGSQGECKRADFIIIADTKSRKIILFIEMKAKKGSEKEIIAQLKGALCFAVYCREIGKAFWGESKFLHDYKNRFVSIGRISIPKRKTRINNPTGTHDRPEKMMKINWPHNLQFNKLVGR